MNIYGKILTSLSLVCLTTSVALSAVPKPNVYDGGNRWNITAFNDVSPVHTQSATQVICFSPYTVNAANNSIEGIWYSLSFPDWNGRYYQEGDELKMTGDYAKDIGHDHMTLQLTTMGPKNEVAFKDWTEWREDGRFGRIIGWANARLVRKGKCPKIIATHEAFSLSKELPERLTLKGEVAKYPSQADLEPLENYLERTGLSAQLRK